MKTKIIKGVISLAMIGALSTSTFPYYQNNISFVKAEEIEEKTGTIYNTITYKLDSDGELHVYNPQNETLPSGLSLYLERDNVDLSTILSINFENKLPVKSLDKMFYNMENLKSVNFNMLTGGYTAGTYNKEQYYASASLNYTFYNCKALETIDLSSIQFGQGSAGVKDSGLSYAFYNCINLKEIKFSESTTPYNIRKDWSQITIGRSNILSVGCDKEYAKEQYCYEWNNPMVQLSGGGQAAGKVAKKIPKTFAITADGQSANFTIEDGIVEMPLESNSYDSATEQPLTIRCYRFVWDALCYQYKEKTGEELEISDKDKETFLSFDAKYLIEKCIYMDKNYRCYDTMPSVKTYYNERTYDDLPDIPSELTPIEDPTTDISAIVQNEITYHFDDDTTLIETYTFEDSQDTKEYDVLENDGLGFINWVDENGEVVDKITSEFAYGEHHLYAVYQNSTTEPPVDNPTEESTGVNCSTPISGKYSIDGNTVTIDSLVLDTDSSYAELCLFGEEYGETPMTLIVKGVNKVKNLIFDTNVDVVCEKGASLSFEDSDFVGFKETGGYTLGENTILEDNTFKYDSTDEQKEGNSQEETPTTTTDKNSESTQPANNDNTYNNTTNNKPNVTNNNVTATVSKTNNEVEKVVSLSKAAGLKGKNKKGKKAYITWKAVDNAQGYEIQIAGKKNMKKLTKVIKVKSTKVTVSKLKKGKTYYIRVRAFNKENNIQSPWSKIIKIKIKK